MKKLSKKLLSVLLIIAMLIPTSTMTLTSNATDSSIEIGDYITLGTYYGESIVWRCVDIDENGPLMLSDKILCFKSFDAKGNHENYYRNKEGTNNWKNSALRYWLNSVGIVDWTNRPAIPNKESVYNGYNSYSEEEGFLSSFSSIELSQIKMVTQKTYINDLDSKYKDGGTGEFYQEGGKFDSSLNNINTSQYMHQYSNDKIFLLDLEQAEAVYHNLGSKYLTAIATKTAVKNDTSEKTGENENYHYWLRVPGTNGMSYENVVTVSDKEEISYMSAFSVRQATYYYSVGVRPAFYLDVDAWESAGEQFPEGYDFDEDSLSFENQGISISEKYYTTLYETEPGKLLYKAKKNVSETGQCFGITMVTAAIYNNLPDVNTICKKRLPDDNTKCECIRQMTTRSTMTIGNVTLSLSDYIKYSFITQWSGDISYKIPPNMDAVLELMQTAVGSNTLGVFVNFYKGISGHSVLAVGVDGRDILIDDPNNIDSLEKLHINEDGSWSFSGNGNFNSETSQIDFVLGGFDLVYNLLKTGTKTEIAEGVLENNLSETYVLGMSKLNSNKLLLYVESDNYDVINENLINVTNNLGTDSVSESEMPGELYWVNEDKTVTISDMTGENNEIIIAGNDVSIGVKTQDDSVVTMTVDEENDDVSAEINSIEGNVYTITFETTDENENDLITTLTGTANSDKVTATETEDGIQVTGLNDITVTYETADGTAETTAKVDDGSTVNITVNDDENTVETDWQCKHPDENHDGICDSCAEDFTKGCSCSCHSNAFMQFLHKILCFLYRIFGMEQYRYCGCGKAHW